VRLRLAKAEPGSMRIALPCNPCLLTSMRARVQECLDLLHDVDVVRGLLHGGAARPAYAMRHTAQSPSRAGRQSPKAP